jgi:hypothetical protein
MRLPAGAALSAILLATASLVSACGSGSTASGTPGAAVSSSSPAALASFRNDYLSFRYPPDWKPLGVRIAQPTLHFNPMVYLGTQKGHDPCRLKAGTTVCGWPVDRLHPNGVLVVWENQGYPGWTLASVKGTTTTIGGRPAKRNVQRPGECSAIGADETVAVAIQGPGAANWTQFTGCLRGPDLATGEHEIDSLLASTTFR